MSIKFGIVFSLLVGLRKFTFTVLSGMFEN